MIPDQLSPYLLPIDELHPWDDNPRRGDVAAVKGSLDRFGLRVPLIYRTELIDGVQRKVVYAGNHRLAAARELGWAEIAAVNADDLSPDEIRAYAIADNRTGDLATYDNEALGALLASMPTDDPTLLDATGYDAKAVDELLDAFQAPEVGNEVTGGEPSDAADDPGLIEPVRCPHCGEDITSSPQSQETADVPST